MKLTNKKFLVFVYGSLLKGLGNHGLLASASYAKFLKEDTVRAKLYTSHWAWPFMVFSQSNKDRLKGEVYEVDYATFRRLDGLEGYRPGRTDGLFTRKTAITASGDKVWIYEGGHSLRSSRADHIEDGDWKKAYLERQPGKSWFDDDDDDEEEFDDDEQIANEA